MIIIDLIFDKMGWENIYNMLLNYDSGVERNIRRKLKDSVKVLDLIKEVEIKYNKKEGALKF